jgi:para-aminobenzoate synthetase component 1
VTEALANLERIAAGMVVPGAPLFAVGPPIVEESRGWVDPLAALAVVRSRRAPVLLGSTLPRAEDARWSILAWDPIATLTLRGRAGRLTRYEPGTRPETLHFDGDPVDLLRALAPAQPEARAAGDLPFSGGAIGCLGYGLRRALERVPPAPPDPLDQPDAWFGFYDRALLFDHALDRVRLLVMRRESARGDARRERRERLLDARRCLEEAAPGEATRVRPDLPEIEAVPDTSRAVYLDRVRAILERIARGDLYQANLSQRISCRLRETPFDLYARLAARNPAPFAAYLDTGPFQVACASPERFVALRAARAVSSPIKGTRPRGRDEGEDRDLARALLESPKDRAENVMIADLVRNDLGRVCEAGSVKAEMLCGLQSFATVHHLVSTLSGRLRPGCDRFDLLRALFPGGSMTGAPKIRAMQVIAGLEGEERGVYSGAIGHLSIDGDLDLNIVIRSVVCGGGMAHARVGGGVVADSEPAAEYDETIDKARALLAALGSRLPRDHASAGSRDFRT